MSISVEMALKVLPYFTNAVLKRQVYSYGYFATCIGRNSSTDSVALGPVFHAIGAACVVNQVPVAPLYFVEREDGEERNIFESDGMECLNVLPHYDLLYVSAREYIYQPVEFERITSWLSRPSVSKLTPHDIWHRAIKWKPNNSEKTYFESALDKYRSFIEENKNR
jgi:hypothetical protein